MTSITLGAYLGERPCPAHETSGAISRRGAGAMFSQGFFRFGRGYVSSYGKRVSSKYAEKALSMTGGTILFWGSVAGVGHYCLSSSFPDGLNASCDGNTVKSMPSGSSTGLKIFTGNANKPLANEIAKHLGINLGKMKVCLVISSPIQFDCPKTRNRLLIIIIRNLFCSYFAFLQKYIGGQVR